MERNKLPREADTHPENLSVKQTVNMVKAILKDCLDITVSISSAEDGVINIDNQFRLWNNGVHWQCYYNICGDGEWTPCYPMGAESPLDFFPRIVQCMARKKLDIWLMQNYLCMA